MLTRNKDVNIDSNEEIIQLKFEFHIELFYPLINHRIDEDGQNRFLAEDIDLSYYRWIVKLAEHKVDHLPSLLGVMLYEDLSQRSPLFSPEEWRAPLSVDWAFDEAGIDLSIKFRDSAQQGDVDEG